MTGRRHRRQSLLRPGAPASARTKTSSTPWVLRCPCASR